MTGVYCWDHMIGQLGLNGALGVYISIMAPNWWPSELVQLAVGTWTSMRGLIAEMWAFLGFTLAQSPDSFMASVDQPGCPIYQRGVAPTPAELHGLGPGGLPFWRVPWPLGRAQPAYQPALLLDALPMLDRVPAYVFDLVTELPYQRGAPLGHGQLVNI